LLLAGGGGAFTGDDFIGDLSDFTLGSLLVEDERSGLGCGLDGFCIWLADFCCGLVDLDGVRDLE